jgi:hypothetical protein
MLRTDALDGERLALVDEHAVTLPGNTATWRFARHRLGRSPD